MALTPRLFGLLTLPPLLWASNVVIGHKTIAYVPPLMLNALRWGGALLVLLVLGWRLLATPAARTALWARWRYLSVMGLLGIGTYNALQYLALMTSTPINVTLIAASLPVFMLLVGTSLFDVHPSRRQVLGTACSMLGVLLVLCRGELHQIAQVRFVPGDLLMLLATLGWAIYSWLLARPPRWALAPVRANVAGADGKPRPWNWAEFLLAQVIYGLLWTAASAGIERGSTDQLIVWSPAVVAAVVFITIGPSVLAYKCWAEGVALGGPALAGIFYNLTPLFAAVLSTWLLGQAPRGYHGLAFVFIVIGIAISTPSQSKQ